MFQQAEKKTYIEERYSSEVAHLLFAPDNHIDRAQCLGDGVERHVFRDGEGGNRVPSCVRFIVWGRRCVKKKASC